MCNADVSCQDFRDTVNEILANRPPTEVGSLPNSTYVTHHLSVEVHTHFCDCQECENFLMQKDQE